MHWLANSRRVVAQLVEPCCAAFLWLSAVFVGLNELLLDSPALSVILVSLVLSVMLASFEYTIMLGSFALSVMSDSPAPEGGLVLSHAL